ncbi:MAG: hypothetical protein ACP5PW_08895, partial [Candidatus Dormibacteria bacterium]
MATVAAGEIGAGRLLTSPPRAVSEWTRRGEHLGLLLAAAESLAGAMPTAVRYGLADIRGEGAYWLPRPRSRPAEENYRIFASNPSWARRQPRRA